MNTILEDMATPTIMIQESSPARSRKVESPPLTTRMEEEGMADEGTFPTNTTEVPTSSESTEETPVEEHTSSNSPPTDSVSVCVCVYLAFAYQIACKGGAGTRLASGRIRHFVPAPSPVNVSQ